LPEVSSAEPRHADHDASKIIIAGGSPIAVAIAALPKKTTDVTHARPPEPSQQRRAAAIRAPPPASATTQHNVASPRCRNRDIVNRATLPPFQIRHAIASL
jgi:hypothetical protein